MGLQASVSVADKGSESVQASASAGEAKVDVAISKEEFEQLQQSM